MKIDRHKRNWTEIGCLSTIVLGLALLFLIDHFFEAHQRELTIFFTILLLIDGIILFVCFFKVMGEEKKKAREPLSDKEYHSVLGIHFKGFIKTGVITEDELRNIIEIFKNHKFEIIGFNTSFHKNEDGCGYMPKMEAKK